MASNRTLLTKYIQGVRAPRNFISNQSKLNMADIVDADSIASLSSSSPLTGDASWVINSTADAEFVEWATDTFDASLVGACLASLTYSGDASLYELRVVDASDNLLNSVALLNSTDPQKVELGFSCQQAKVRIHSTGDGAEIKVDDLYIGEDYRVGSVAQAYDFGSLTYALNPGCLWSNTTASITTPDAFGEDADCATPSVTGRIKAPSTKIPAFVIPGGSPSGTYKITATGSFLGTRLATIQRSIFSFFDGVTHHNVQTAGINVNNSGSTTTITNIPVLTGSIEYTTSSTDTLIEVRGAASVSGSTPSTSIDASSGSGAGAPLVFNVTYLPSSSQIALTGDTTDLSGFAKSAATSGCQWETTSGTIDVFAEDLDCPTMTTSGNAQTLATKIPGFIVPKLLPGKYQVVAQATLRASASTSGSSACVFELHDGTSSGGATRITKEVNLGIGSHGGLTGQFEYTSVQTNKVFQIRAYRATGDGLCAVVNNSDSDLTFTLIPLSQALPAPFIPGSVFAGRSGVTKVGAARFSCADASAILDNADGMLSGVGNVSSGVCALTFAAGYFSASPVCTVSHGVAANSMVSLNVYSVAASGANLKCRRSSTTSSASTIEDCPTGSMGSMHITCIGKG
jgi:hypothetical protein